MKKSRRQSDEVPQWVRDHIVTKKKQIRRESSWRRQAEGTTEQIEPNTYLLSPFSQQDEEAIRAGLYELRREYNQEEDRKFRESIEKGEFVSDRGFSSGPIDEGIIQKYLLSPLSRQEMQQVLVNYYGWKEWSEDPWGDSTEFNKWLDTVGDNAYLVWAVNETGGGRFYYTIRILVYLTLLGHPDVKQHISPELVWYWIGVGAKNFLILKRYSAWEYFIYLQEPLPADFINQEVIKMSLSCPMSLYRPFMSYSSIVSSIYHWRLIMQHLNRKHESFLAFISLATGNDTRITELNKELAPDDYQHPDKEKSWELLEEPIRKNMERIASKFSDVFPIVSKVGNEDGEGHDILTESYLAAQEGLYEGVLYWKGKEVEALGAALEGRFEPSLLRVIKNDLADAAKKVHRKREVTESEIDASRVDEEERTQFLDTRPAPDQNDVSVDDNISLEDLRLDLDALNPKERMALQDVLQGLSEGYEFDSKTGMSFRQRWGEDYQRNKKAWERAKAKLNIDEHHVT